MARGTDEYPRVSGITLGLLAFFLHSALDMNWPFPANPAMAFALVAVLAAYERISMVAPAVREDSRRIWALHWRVGAAVILLLAGVSSYLMWAGQQKFLEGRRLVRLRQWPAAAATFRSAMLFNPLNPRSPSGLAVALERMGAREEEITAAIKRSMKLDPMTAYYPMQLAEVIYRRGPSSAARRDEAIRLLRHTLMLDPYHQPQAYGMLARIYEGSGDLQQAEAAFRGARDRYGRGWTDDGILRAMLWPGVSGLYMEWARFLIRQGRLSDAGAIYQEILAEDPRYVPAYLGGADVLLRQRRVNDAVEFLRRGLERVPASDQLWRQWRRLSVGRSAIWEQ